MNLPEFTSANYKGISFSVPSSERSVQHALVQYHSPYTQHSHKDDLGLSSEQLSIRAFVSGQNAYVQADKLRKALDERGEGVLSHPAYGELNVYVASYQESQGYVDGLYYIEFQLSFLRADERKVISSVRLEEQAKERSTVFQKRLSTSIKEELAELGLTNELLSLGQVRKVLADINSDLKALFSLAEIPFEFSNTLFEIGQQIADLNLDSASQTLRIFDMGTNTVDAFLAMPLRNAKLVAKLAANAKSNVAKLAKLKSKGHLYNLQLQQTAAQITNLGVLTMSAEYHSREEAQAASAKLNTLFGKLKHHVGYELYAKLMELEQLANSQMQAKAKNLPKQKSLIANEPLLVAMHRVRGKAIQGVPNPFFPSGNSGNSESSAVIYV